MKRNPSEPPAPPLETPRAPEAGAAPIDATAARANPAASILAGAEWLLFALLAAYMAAHTLPRAWRKLNTDFPDYYLTAHLAHQGDSVSRIYEWIWLQREKDRLPTPYSIDRPIVGMGATTAFSTLAVWPLSSLPPLPAKRCWLALSMGMLALTLLLLRSITGLPWRRILLVAALSFPLHIDFLFGQYYALLLLVLTLACWLYLHRRSFWAGVMIGLAFGMKIFPILYLLYFLRKKDWKAFAGGLAGSMTVAAASIGIFGWPLNRTYAAQVLPWALRGEALDPYALQSASISSLLHRLFVYEPLSNPHPAWNAPWLLAVLLPLLQLAVFAPVILLATPTRASLRNLRLEWAALLLAILAISTLSLSYQFTLLILPVCLLWEALPAQKRPFAAAALLFLYLAVGYPRWRPPTAEGWPALLDVPRLYAIVALTLFACVLLWRNSCGLPGSKDRAGSSVSGRWAWPALLACGLALSIFAGLRHQHGLYRSYRWRLPAPGDMYMATHPAPDGPSIFFTAMLPDGYRTGELRGGLVRFRPGGFDQLAVAAASGQRWIEEDRREPRIVSAGRSPMEIDDAEFPEASPDGKLLAFLREEHGRARIWLRDLDRAAGEDRPITPSGLDVLEMSFLPDDRLIFSATSGRAGPALFLVDLSGHVTPFLGAEARFPAVSPDGRWLAYSRLQGGNWRLWIRQMHTGESQRITNADCNNMWPAWEADSRTLVYASDCGRALWFTALCRRPVAP